MAMETLYMLPRPALQFGLVVNAENAERQWRLASAVARVPGGVIRVVNAENAERQWRPVNSASGFIGHLLS